MMGSESSSCGGISRNASLQRTVYPSIGFPFVRGSFHLSYGREGNDEQP